MTKRLRKIGEDGESSERPGSGRQQTQDQVAEKFLTDLQREEGLKKDYPQLSETISTLLSTRQKLDLVISLPVPKPKGTERDEDVPQDYRLFYFAPTVSVVGKEFLLSTMKKARREADDYVLDEEHRVKAYIGDIRWALGQMGIIHIGAQLTSAAVHAIEQRFNYLVDVPPDTGQKASEEVQVEGGNALLQRAKLAAFHHEAKRAKDTDDKSRNTWYWHVDRVRREKGEQVRVPYIEDFCMEVYNYLDRKFRDDYTNGQHRFLELALFDLSSHPAVTIHHQGESFEKSLRDLVYSYVMYAYRLTYLKVCTSDFLWIQTEAALENLIGRIPEVDETAKTIPSSVLRKIQDNVNHMIAQDPILSGALTIYRRFPEDRTRRYRNPLPQSDS